MSVIVVRQTARRSQTSSISTDTHCFPASQSSAVVSVGSSATLDSYQQSLFGTVKWYVAVCTADRTKMWIAEVFSTVTNGTASYVLYGMVGDSLSITIDVVCTTSVQLVITNNDNTPFEVYATRISVPYDLSTPQPTSQVPTTINRSIISPLTASAIDVFDESVVGVKWLVTIIDSHGNQSSMQVIANSKYANEYAVTGDVAQYAVDVNTIPGFGTELVLTNTSSNYLKVIVSRTPIVAYNTDVSYCTVPTILWVPVQVTVSPNSTVPIDPYIITPNQTGAKWLICAYDQTTGDMLAQEMIATMTSTETNDIPYARIGTRMDISFFTQPNVGFCQLMAKNNTSIPLTVNLVRVPVGL